MAGLKEWFKQDWVDIGAKKKMEVLKEKNKKWIKEEVSKVCPCLQKQDG